MTLMKYITVVNLLKKTNCNVNIAVAEVKYLVLQIQLLLMLLETRHPMLAIQSKKESYDTNILNIDAKFFTTPECNKFIAEILDKKGKTLVDKSDIR